MVFLTRNDPHRSDEMHQDNTKAVNLKSVGCVAVTPNRSKPDFLLTDLTGLGTLP